MGASRASRDCIAPLWGAMGTMDASGQPELVEHFDGPGRSQHIHQAPGGRDSHEACACLQKFDSQRGFIGTFAFPASNTKDPCVQEVV